MKISNPFGQKGVFFGVLLILLVIGGCVEPSASVEEAEVSVQEGNGDDPNIPYQRPPEAIAAMVESSPTPSVSLDETGWMLIMEEPGYPPIEKLARPELRIAGMRVNPSTNGPSRADYYNNLQLKKIEGGQAQSIQGLPSNPEIRNISWSPDGERVAFTNTRDEGIELWVIDAAEQRARKLTEPVINDAWGYGDPYVWMSDSEHLVAKFVDEGRGESPEEPEAPRGPVIQEHTGGSAPMRTYQDLLEDQRDEELFEYHFTAQLKLVDVGGSQEELGEPAIIKRFDPSPNGEYFLVEKIHRPYSYLVRAAQFPYKVEILDTAGEVVKELADVPLAEDIPIGRDAVDDDPRHFRWRSDAPETVFWVEAQDGGDPEQEADVRDEVNVLQAPFEGQPQPLVTTSLRFDDIYWGDEGLAIVQEEWWKDRRERSLRIDPSDLEREPEVLIDRLFEDSYDNPGDPVLVRNDRGREVLLTDEEGQRIFMFSEGGSPEGNRPFYSSFDLSTKDTEILWRSEAPYYEQPVKVIDPAGQGQQLITRRESLEEQPNYFLRDLQSGDATQVTDFPNPVPQLQDVTKELIRYEREDGLPLTATLYLPEDYNQEEDAPLPVLMWAYPREYKTADAAGQVKRSPYRFSDPYWGSPVYFVTQGYAVLDGTEMPIVGEGDAQPNDTFRQQLIANAQAAIDEVVSMGIADPDRIAVGGHSYGAFMTANLVTHSDLFAAGIARSGAYNRTFTPFGFQNEERTYWESPETYYEMSPFMHADEMKTPLLLTHGLVDNNSGTFPVQSRRYYHALKGHGATVRLVYLPHESHGYEAKASVMHTLWEMNRWLDMHVKGQDRSFQASTP